MARYRGRHRTRFFDGYTGRHQAPDRDRGEYVGAHRGEYVGVHTRASVAAEQRARGPAYHGAHRESYLAQFTDWT